MRITPGRATALILRRPYGTHLSLHGRSCLLGVFLPRDRCIYTGQIYAEAPKLVPMPQTMFGGWRCASTDCAQCIWMSGIQDVGEKIGGSHWHLQIAHHDRSFVTFISAIYIYLSKGAYIYRHLLIIFLLTDCFFFSLAYFIFEKLY